MRKINQQTSLLVLLLLLVIIPFVNAVREFPSAVFSSDLPVTSILNYLALTGAVILFLQTRLRFNFQVVLYAVLAFCLLLVNLMFAEHASAKWAINWVGFILVYVAVAGAFAKMPALQACRLQLFCKRTFLSLLSITALLLLWVWMRDYTLVFYFTEQSMYNHSIALARDQVGLEKQALGTLAALVIVWSFASWHSLKIFEKSTLIISLIVFMPALIGIRTLFLGLGAFLLIRYFLKNGNRFFLGIGVLVFLVLAFLLYRDQMVDIIQDSYDRYHSLAAAISTAFEKPFGVGNGGYHIFVEANNLQIVGRFGSEKMLETGSFWLAPESDLVYFIASWGLLSLFFFAFLGWCVTQGTRFIVSRNISPTHIEKTVVTFSIIYILMGISQDNAGGIIWWTYLGAATGILIRHRPSSRKHGQLARIRADHPSTLFSYTSGEL